jgi:hypothetical protein
MKGVGGGKKVTDLETNDIGTKDIGEVIGSRLVTRSRVLERRVETIYIPANHSQGLLLFCHLSHFPASRPQGRALALVSLLPLCLLPALNPKIRKAQTNRRLRWGLHCMSQEPQVPVIWTRKEPVGRNPSRREPEKNRLWVSRRFFWNRFVIDLLYTNPNPNREEEEEQEEGREWHLGSVLQMKK